ncbi:response regulator [Flavobacterium sp. XS2P14]|uniref:response regulator n=1 Tax=unclassified Flavobacterium TaxID=196869 RepID=UPI003AAF3CFF
MQHLRIVLILIFGVYLFGGDSFAQTKVYSKQEITKLNDKASRYLKNANFEKSLNISKVALRSAMTSNDLRSTAISYTIIAGNYAEMAEFDKAIFFYNKSLSYAQETNNDTLRKKIFNNLGNIYCFEKKQYDKGINYYKNSLIYSQKLADNNQVFMTKINIAWAYFDSGLFEKGFPSLEFINKYNKTFGDESTVVAVNLLNGMYSSNKGNQDTASSFFEKAIKFGNQGNEKSDLSYSYLEYSKHLLKNSDYKKAYENLTLYNTITNDLYNKEKLENANLVGINLELDAYKREIDKIESEKLAQEQSIRKSKIIVGLFVLIVCILIVLLYTLLKNNSFKKKANIKLSQTNTELLAAKEKIEEVSALKAQFFSTISHELRTPLYGVVGITNMLLDEHKELVNSPHLNSLKFSARYLLSLVNDILQINKIEDNKIVLESLTFNISDEIEMIKSSLSFMAKTNANEIIVNIDDRIPEYLIGDKLRLSQIIMNLVSNALKFTKNGAVSIHVNLAKVENNFYFLEFKIQDNGIGIDPLDQEKIFDKFVQVNRKETDYQGTGLGLSIVKQLLGLFDSDITLQSSVGKGTEFQFVIAFEHNMERTAEIINNIQVEISSTQMIHVLVVEDNRINQMITRKTIEKNNYKCSVVDNGYDALEILEKENFDLILMDINMPLINGFETTKLIRLKGIDIPIVALTAFNKAEITEEALSAGINDIIIKPFDSFKLFEIIKILTSKSKK